MCYGYIFNDCVIIFIWNYNVSLSSVYGIIMDREINAPDHGENVLDGPNATDKIYFK